MRFLRGQMGLYARWTTLLCSVVCLSILGMTAGCSAPATPTPRVADLTPFPVAVITPSPEATPTQDLQSAITPTPPPTSEVTATRTPESTPTPDVEVIPLSLDLLAPVAGAGVEVGAVRVLGVTSPDASVKVNGVETEVGPDGTFQRDLILQEGINSILAVASGPSGAAATDNVLVLFVPRPEGVPLSVLFPQGFEVQQPEITIIGATRQDAVVGVNGIPVDVNSLGIFSTAAPLEEGANLIEVVAVDLEENVNFQTVVVFYIPGGSPGLS